jgi:hypothetical protein
MEHRRGRRKAVDIRATVELVTGNTLPARIANVSFGGILVEVATKNMRLHTPIRLRFQLNRQNQTQVYRWRGFITRIIDRGVGAMFQSADPEEQAGWLALLDIAEHRNAASVVAGWR